MTARPSLRLLAAAWAGLALAVTVLLPGSTGLRALACLPLALYLPGFAFLHAIGRPRDRTLEWEALAVVTSVAGIIPGGLLLDRLGMLGPLGWAAWLSGVTWALLGASLLRPAPRPAAVAPGRGIALPRPLVLGGFLLALGLAGAAATIAIDDGLNWREFKFSEFWMLPDVPERPGSVVIGARNAEGRPMVYAIAVMQDGLPIASWGGIALEPGASATRNLPLVVTAGTPSRVEAWLFESGSPGTIYRKVWLNIGAPGA